MNTEKTHEQERTHYASRLLSRMLNDRKKPEHRTPAPPAPREVEMMSAEKKSAVAEPKTYT
ncbi:MAG: hypothetical protein ACRD3W_22225 [Terriglobales bacterium]